MGSLKLGIITTYMSDPLVSGFTTAAGVYGGSGQIKHIFGIKIPRSYGMFQIIKVSQFMFYSKRVVQYIMLGNAREFGN